MIKPQDFLNRLNYNRVRFKFIEKLSFRYYTFYDRARHVYSIYKIFDHEAHSLLKRVVPEIGDHSIYLVRMVDTPSYKAKRWALSKIRSMDATRHGTITTFDILDADLRRIDDHVDGQEQLDVAMLLDRELKKDYQQYMRQGKITRSGLVKDDRLHKRMKPKKITFVSPRTGKKLGVLDVAKRKLTRYDKTTPPGNS